MVNISYKNLYIPCVSCDNWCSDIIRDDNRHIPRSFYSEAQPGSPVVMFLSMNPGGGKKGPIEPEGFYKGTPEEKVEKHFEFGREKFVFPKKGFHRKLRKQIIEILSMPWEKAKYHFIITALFKCTSIGDGMASNTTISTCVDKHLKRELLAWQPLCIFTLGKGVKSWVDDNPQVFQNYNIGGLTHPSFSGTKSKGMTDNDFIEEAKNVLSQMPNEVKNKINLLSS